MVKEWFEEYVNSGKGKTHRIDDDSEFIIYKGFKILRDREHYTLEDTRFSDLYTRVSDFDLMRLQSHGFMEGCDRIKYVRDSLRLEKHRLSLEELSEDRQTLADLNLDKSSREYKKRNNKLTAARQYHSKKYDYYDNKMKKVETEYNLLRHE